jgi:hypothetical protein
MVSQQVIELAIKTVGAEKAAADLDNVARGQAEVRNAGNASGAGGFSGQLAGTVSAGAQREEVSLNQQVADSVQQVATATTALSDEDRKLAEEKATLIQKAGEEALAHLRAAASAKSHEDQLRRIELATRALVGVQIIGQLSGMLSEFRALVPAGSNTAAAIEGVEAASGSLTAGFNTFIATGNPMLAVMASLAGGAKGVYDAYVEMAAAQKSVSTGMGSVQKSMVDSETYHRNLAQSVRNDQLVKQLDSETAANERLNDSFRRSNEIRRAQEELAAAQGQAGGASQGEQAVARTSSQAAEFASQVKQAEQNLVAMNSQMTTQVELVRSLEKGNGSIAELDAAIKKRDEMSAALNKAQEDLVAMNEVGMLKLQAVAVQGQQVITDEAVTFNTETAEKFKAKMEELKASNGGQLDTLGQAALDRVNQMLEDGKILQNEMANLKSAMDQGRQSRQAADQTTLGYFATLAADSNSHNSRLKALEGQMQAISDRGAQQ